MATLRLASPFELALPARRSVGYRRIANPSDVGRDQAICVELPNLERNPMYCIHCGADSVATFCAVCGRRQLVDGQLPAESNADHCDPPDSNAGSANSAEPVIEASICWTDSIQYETVLASPEPRERIAAAGRGANQGVTGDDLLAVFDAVSPIGISLGKLTNAILPIYDKLGIKTDRQSQAVFDAAPGRVLLATMCTLAEKSLTIVDVRQDTHECALTAEIPSGLITNRGKLHAVITVHEQYVQVSLATTISGQWYDFGKSKRLIDDMFQSIYNDVTSQQSGNSPRYRRVA